MITTTDDTIVAIATANGIGSIAIVRISGDRALHVAKKLSNKEDFVPRYATLSTLYGNDGNLIDEAIIIYFKAPHSFTAEDVIELQCHGGFVVANTILKECIKLGCRLANPGEFSKRAFLNGRIDLSEAEAIAKLIEAKSEDAAKILSAQMKGSLKTYIEKIRDDILHVMAFSEVNIDYAEEDLPQDLQEQMQQKLQDIITSLKSTLQRSKQREGLMQGFCVAIVGKPNVGKSSLLNAMLDYNRAIVSSVAGTTRDTIEEQIKIGSHLIRIVDTAGIRNADDEIEQIGIQRSIEAVEKSDIVIALFDASREFDKEDDEILSLLKKYQDKKIIYIKNKIDLQQNFACKDIKFDLELNSKESVDKLMSYLNQYLDTQNISDEIMLISQRQINSVENTLKNIQDSITPLQDGELEIFSFYLLEATKALSSITRPFENDEMLDKMFGSFCLGK